MKNTRELQEIINKAKDAVVWAIQQAYIQGKQDGLAAAADIYSPDRKKENND